MKSVSKIALGAALALGCTSVVASPALAQKNQEAEQQGPQLSKEERAALVALQTAVNANDNAAATAALPAAQAAAQSPDARYLLGALQLKLGVNTNNVQLQSQAIDAMIASGGADAATLPDLYRNQAALALQAGNEEKAEAAAARLAELVPNDPQALATLAEMKIANEDLQGGLVLLDRAIDLRRAATNDVPENWYKRGLKIAFDSKLGPQSVKMSRDLLAAYPSAENWRDSLLIYRDLTRFDDAATLDLLRLMRTAGALNGERDYFELAQTANDAGLPGEAKAVLDEGIRKKMVDGNKGIFKELATTASGRIAEDKASLPGLEKKAMAASTGALALSTADAYYGYGNYAKAAELYRAALQKGSVDTNLVNTRLGMALALSNNRAEAEAAFRSVTGIRSDLAAYWLLWLSQQG